MKNEGIKTKLEKSRFTKIALSSASAIILKAVTFLCTFILTRLIIKIYGSEVNGMIGSIGQFLGFITLLEGGIGGVARAALYKPLSQKDNQKVEKIVTYLERFFRILALIFVAYALVVAFVFPVFSDSHGFYFTFFLVLILSASLFAEYFFGMSYTILLASDQKAYISNFVTFFTALLNFVVCLVLIKVGCSIHIVKLASVGMLILRPIVLSVYCKIKYRLKKVKLEKKENLLPQKWSGFGVHIAYYLHRNTDTFLLTLFLSLTMVSVYSVYNMVISGILAIIGSLSIGIEAAFGNMYAKHEFSTLKDKFKTYMLYYQFLCTFLLSPTMVLIIPFVKIYTAGIEDANYVQPVFALIFVLSEFVYCLRVPYNDLMVATDSFKKIQWGAFGEAIINIVVSIILVNIIGLPGVAIGTLLAMIFRLIHFLIFFKKHDLKLETGWFFKITLTSFAIFLVNCLISRFLNVSPGTTYFTWAAYAIVVCVFSLMNCFLGYSIMCNRQMNNLIHYFLRKVKSK